MKRCCRTCNSEFPEGECSNYNKNVEPDDPIVTGGFNDGMGFVIFLIVLIAIIFSKCI